MINITSLWNSICELIERHPGIAWTHLTLHPDTFHGYLLSLGFDKPPPAPWTLFGFLVDTSDALQLDEVTFHGPSCGSTIILEPVPPESKYLPRTWMPTVKHPLIEQDKELQQL